MAISGMLWSRYGEMEGGRARAFKAHLCGIERLPVLGLAARRKNHRSVDLLEYASPLGGSAPEMTGTYNWRSWLIVTVVLGIASFMLVATVACADEAVPPTPDAASVKTTPRPAPTGTPLPATATPNPTTTPVATPLPMATATPNPTATSTATPPPTATATPRATPTPTPESGSTVDALALWDDNGNGRITCAEAREHGIAPVRSDHPAYPYMDDRDGDGIVCE